MNWPVGGAHGSNGLALARMLPRRRAAAARHARGRAARHQPAGVEPVAGAAAIRSRRAIVPRAPAARIRLTKPGERVPGAGRARARARSRTAAASLPISKPPIAGTIALGLPAHAGRQIHPGAGPPLQPRPSRTCDSRFVQNNSADDRGPARTRRTGPHLRGGAARPHADFDWARVVDQEFVLIVPHGHRLARRRQVRLREVADERFVSFKQGHAIRRDDRRSLQGRRLRAGRSASRRDNSSSVPGFVAAGFGVGIVPPEACRLRRCGEPARSPSRWRGAPIGIAWVEDRYLSASAQAVSRFRDCGKIPCRPLIGDQCGGHGRRIFRSDRDF